jgi:group I intron endonuclease
MGKISGIYSITSVNSGRVYIGSAVDFLSRKRIHLHYLRRGRHHSAAMQKEWNVHGESGFHFDLLEQVVDVKKLIERERWWLDFMETATRGFNTALVAGSQLGYRHTEETKRLMREKRRFQKMKPRTEETKRKMAEARKGWRYSAEQRAAMSGYLRGRKMPPVSEETKRKIGNANRGRKLPPISEETRRKISAASKGRKYPTSFGKKISEALKGRSSGMAGKKHSDETRHKMAESARKREALKKALKNEGSITSTDKPSREQTIL